MHTVRLTPVYIKCIYSDNLADIKFHETLKESENTTKNSRLPSKIKVNSNCS